MGDDIDDLPPHKTISGPYQSYQIRVSVTSLAELKSISAYVDGAPCFFRDKGVPWYWFALLPAGNVVSADGSTGAIAATHGGYWVSILNLIPPIPSTKLAPFTGVNNATARLLKAISASELATLQEGDAVYVESFRDYFKWLPLSFIPGDDVLYVTPTVVGVGLGRFERMLIPSNDWMLQGQWVISPTAPGAHVENSGADLAHALTTDDERFRRMGSNNWSLSAYHLRILEDGLTVRLHVGSCSAGTNIFVHGSMVDGAGQSPLYSGTIDTLTTLDPATNVPWGVLSNGIPVSWTASGLLNTRLRDTTQNAIAWVGADVGAKTAQLTETIPFSPFVTPYVFATASVTLVQNDTIVAERLTTIAQVYVTGNAELSSGGNLNIFFDSVDLGGTTGDGFQCAADNTGFVFWGCSFRAFLTSSVVRTATFLGCKVPAMPVRPMQVSMFACYPGAGAASATYRALGSASLTRCMSYGGILHLVCDDPSRIDAGWNIGTRLGLMNITTAPQGPTAAIVPGNRLFLAGTTIFWGSGNTVRLFGLQSRASIVHLGSGVLTAATFPYSTTMPTLIAIYANDFNASQFRTAVPWYDQTTGLFTFDRSLSVANMLALASAGGFCNTTPGVAQWFDPVSGCSWGISA